MVYYLIAIIIIIVDQLTKLLVISNMELRQSIPIIEGFLYLTSHRNPGAAFGILPGQMWLFYIVTAIVVGFIIYYIQTKVENNKWLGISLGLILGGAIGNFIDRVIYGEVVDFIDVFIFSYNYPIFNVADCALVIGFIFVIFIIYLEDKKQGKVN
ncbi:signal peptidase II [Evansella cellulosilytica]|uniref:Lipoprotein signal peptidase n=1 Tax=Evansella cellulosilytica (strain ATCC 21833 / DSM 2522 / FERM P-1141 / JCM 9156 / N-4) TaxID=649639 RepID=E6TTR2_EVAC2|nr:signal peptidase II [Evansella cellulosilytica]ADU30831.1 lipoprotein signal peptidase [Evansella cellulosilytica DSM 2522]